MSIRGSLNPPAISTALQCTRAGELDVKKSSDAALLVEPGKPWENQRVAPAFNSDETNAHQQACDEAVARMRVTLNGTAAQASEAPSQIAEHSAAGKAAGDAGRKNARQDPQGSRHHRERSAEHAA